MRILITGSSGLIGAPLCRHLEAQGHEVIRLVRREPSHSAEVRWDPAAGELNETVVEGLDAAVNLAGAGVGDKRWTEEYRALVWDSRVDSTALLADALAAADAPPRVIVSSSAIGIYGDRGDEALTEESEPAGAGDFLADLVKAWEDAAAPAKAAGIRTVFARTGIVMDDQGGALGRILLPFKFGLGGRLGSGDQWWSWISIADEVRAIAHLLDADLSGPVNLTAPNPVTNAEFTRILGEVLGRPTLLPVPRLALEVALGKERAAALAFTSAKVLPQKLLDSGFAFTHPTLEEALRAELR